MYPDIDKGTESGDIGHDAGKPDARPHILDFLHPFGEVGGFRYRAINGIVAPSLRRAAAAFAWCAFRPSPRTIFAMCFSSLILLVCFQ
jgi:hypothetical protein